MNFVSSNPYIYDIEGTPSPSCLTKFDSSSCNWWSEPDNSYFQINILNGNLLKLKSITFLSYPDNVPPNKLKILGTNDKNKFDEIYTINDTFCRDKIYDNSFGYDCPPNFVKKYEINSKSFYKFIKVEMDGTNMCKSSYKCCTTCFLLGGIRFEGKISSSGYYSCRNLEYFQYSFDKYLFAVIFMEYEF